MTEKVCDSAEHKWEWIPWDIANFQGYWHCKECGVFKYAQEKVFDLEKKI